MRKDIVTERQAIFIIAIFILGTSMITGIAKDAGENAWIALICATILSIPFQLMYARMLANFPEKNILEITDIVFGKIISKLFGLFFLWNALYLGANILKLLNQFISIVDLDKTPEMIVIILITVFIMQMLKCGINVFGRWSEFFFYLLLIAYVLISTTLMPLKILDNITPILYEGTQPVIEGTFHALLTTMTQTFIFLLLFTNFSRKKSYYKIFLIGTLIGSILLFIMTVDVILVIGKHNYEFALFPPYVTLRRLHIGTFFQRFEMLLIPIFVIVGFIKIVSVYLSALISIKQIIHVEDYKPFAIPICLLIAVLGYLTYSDFLLQEDIVHRVYMPFALVANIIVPFIIFIAEEIYIRVHLSKHKNST